MADHKFIRDLTNATGINGSQYLPLDQGSGVLKRATINSIIANSNLGTRIYNVLDYGAIGNGSEDDTEAIQNAINAAASAGGGIVTLCPGTFRITASLTCSSNLVCLSGSGMYLTVLHLDSATATAISASGTISGFTVENMTIICFNSSDNTRTDGSGITLSDVGDWRIENVRFLSPWIGIICDTASTGLIYNCAIEGYSAVTNYGLTAGIKLDDTCIRVVIRDTTITSGVAYTCGIEIDQGMDTLVIDDCGVTNATKCIYIHNSSGGIIHDPRWIRINNSYLEPVTTTGIGIEFAECYDVEVTNLYTCWGLHGLYFTSGSHVIRIRGGIIQLAYQHGILLNSGTDIDIDNVHITDNSQQATDTYDGIAVESGVSHFSIVNCRTGNFLWNESKKQNYGINILTGPSDYYRIVHCSSHGDVAGGINDNGTGINKNITDNI